MIFEEINELKEAIKTEPKKYNVVHQDELKQVDYQMNKTEKETDKYLNNIVSNINKIKSLQDSIMNIENKIIDIKEEIGNYNEVVINLESNLDRLKNNIASLDYIIDDQIKNEIYNNISILVEEKTALGSEIEQIGKLKVEYYQKIKMLEKKMHINVSEIENFKKIIENLKNEIKICNDFINKLIM